MQLALDRRRVGKEELLAEEAVKRCLSEGLDLLRDSRRDSRRPARPGLLEVLAALGLRHHHEHTRGRVLLHHLEVRFQQVGREIRLDGRFERLERRGFEQCLVFEDVFRLRRQVGYRLLECCGKCLVRDALAILIRDLESDRPQPDVHDGARQLRGPLRTNVLLNQLGEEAGEEIHDLLPADDCQRDFGDRLQCDECCRQKILDGRRRALSFAQGAELADQPLACAMQVAADSTYSCWPPADSPTNCSISASSAAKSSWTA